jgi:lipid-A-disaccharide synthase
MNTSQHSSLRVALVAGEASGDQLGAALITALRARVPNVQCFGVAGPKMIAAGCEPWASAEELAVMGLSEVLRHLPRLLRLRRELKKRLLSAPPTVFIGIDAPEFNLGLAHALKLQGIRTVQYVSPQVWAWRPGRVEFIRRAVDLVLCLLPFETDFYSKHKVKALFVGHPLADQIPLTVDREHARNSLKLSQDAPVIALLPGSRRGEVARLGADFIAAAAWLAAQRPDVRFVAPMANAAVQQLFMQQLAQAPQKVAIKVQMGGAQTALIAADAALVASGTATLETLLCRRPMVVAYRLAKLTAFILRLGQLVKVPYFSQPNLLLGRARVPEFFQEAVSGAALGAALLAELADEQGVVKLTEEFHQIHQRLRCGGADRAALAVLQCAGVLQ